MFNSNSSNSSSLESSFSQFQQTSLSQFQNIIMASRSNQQLESLLFKRLQLKPALIEGAMRRAVASKKLDLLRHTLEVNKLLPHDSTMRISEDQIFQQLQKAVTRQDLETLKCLLPYLVETKDPMVKEQLHHVTILAAQLGFLSAVQLLCTALPLCLRQTLQGHNVLPAISHNTSEEATSVAANMLRLGAYINSQEPDGNTALHVAVQEQNLPMVRLLLVNGACVMLKNAQNQSPLDVSDNPEITSLLQANRSLLPHQVSLYCAAKIGDEEAIKRLISKGIPVDMKWVCGRTALSAAAINGDEHMLTLLMRFGASPFPAGSAWPEIPIAHALRHHHVVISCQLMKQMENQFSMVSKKERKSSHDMLVELLHLCAKVGATSVAKLILNSSYGIKPKAFLNGLSALHTACRYGQLEMVKLLLKMQVDPKIPNVTYCNTPFHYACFYGQICVASYLLSLPSVTINCENKQHETPLFCVLHGQLSGQEKGIVRESTVVFLIGRGAKLTKPGRKNCELDEFDLRYAAQRWDFIPFHTQKLIMVLRDECKPYSLCNLARFAIRGAIERPVNEDVVEDLNLPYRMQNYVLLKDWFPTN